MILAANTWDFSNTLTAINVTLTLLYCVLTGLIFWAAHRQLTALTRPYLYFGLEFHGTIVEAVLKNTGKSPALNVFLEVNPALRTHIRNESRPSRLSNTKGFTIPANAESREFLGSWQDVCVAEGSLIFTVCLKYEDSSKKLYTESMRINFEHNRDRAFINRRTVEDHLAEISNTLKGISRK
jgi:hypothetical protein